MNKKIWLRALWLFSGLAVVGVLLIVAQSWPWSVALGWIYGVGCGAAVFAQRVFRGRSVATLRPSVVQPMLLYGVLERLVLALLLLLAGLWLWKLPTPPVVLSFIAAHLVGAFVSAAQLMDHGKSDERSDG